MLHRLVAYLNYLLSRSTIRKLSKCRSHQYLTAISAGKVCSDCSGFSRRQVLAFLGLAFLLPACRENQNSAEPQSGAGEKDRASALVNLGPLNAFKEGPNPLPVYRLCVFKDGERVSVLDMVCTHQSCLLKLKAQGFECPCHGSLFTLDGTLLEGPARESLFWFKPAISPRQELLVDLRNKSRSRIYAS